MRSVQTTTIAGQRFVFTKHSPSGAASDLALVLFNGGQVPRDGHAGLNVRLADTAAACGLSAYRVDLPGLGDAPGPLPTTAAEFWHANALGLQTEAALQVLSHLQAQAPHQRLLVGGLCGAANNALFCAARRPGLIQGLVLIEPELFFGAAPGSAAAERTPERAHAWLPKLCSRQAWLRLLTSENRYTRSRPVLRRLLMAMAPRAVLLGGSTNGPLAEAFASACHAGLPMLCILALDGRRALHVERVERTLIPRRARALLDKEMLAGTNHVLTEGGAIERCAHALERWLSRRWSSPGPVPGASAQRV
ncbi:hypothetical protein [uncultured Thiohalocapsa sp.]|uniref:hypothetical protein n=1 Tax=uncultured Thiohalocapsa sp. TaxID=768990 RepID=UPI0025D143AF|nr:hypothetical protein [uncultured Thiohalocapsa sp.]